MDDYQYQPLDAQTSNFRLLRLRKGDTLEIECDIFHATISDHNAIKYEALSYTWGSTDLVEIIKVNGQRLWITENLYSALQCLRYHDHDRILWIDAVCINQSDMEERSQQVLEMGRIFGFATRVIFWLGKPTAEAILLMKTLGELQNLKTSSAKESLKGSSTTLETLWSKTQQTQKSQNGDKSGQQRKGLEVLLKRPWFERVWILQEVLNARSAIVSCGAFSVSTDIFALSPSILKFSPDPHVQSVLDIMPRQTRTEPQQNGDKDDLHNLLLKFRASKATDKRDMIFALLGISSEPWNHELLRPDYTKSIQEVLHSTLRYWFEAKDVSVSEVIHCLACFDTIRVIYLVPQRRLGSKEDEIEVPPYSVPISFVKDASLFMLESFRREKARQHDTCYAELDLLQSRLDDYRDESSEELRTSLRIVSWQIFEQTIKFLVVENAKDALLLAGMCECRRLLAFIADKSTDNGPKLLYDAIKKATDKRWWGVVQLLLELDADFNAQGNRLDKTLQAASYEGPIEVVQALLDQGAEVNTEGREYGSPLQAAASAGGRDRLGVIQLLLDKGANIDAQGKNFDNALQIASEKGHLETVQFLLDKGAYVNAIGRQSGSALQAASKKGHLEVMQLLLNNRADVDVYGGLCDDAFSKAFDIGHVEIVRLLLEKGTNTDTQIRDFGNMLWRASRDGRLNMVQLLLEKGANSYTQRQLNHALAGAALKGSVEISQLLLENGAEVNWTKKTKFYGALGLAARKGHLKVVQLLLEKGANVNDKSELNGSPLYMASKNGHLKVVQQLLDSGAEIDSKEGQWDNALYAASQEGHVEVVQLLLKSGAIVNPKKRLWDNALEAASRRDHKQIVQILIQHGARWLEQR